MPDAPLPLGRRHGLRRGPVLPQGGLRGETQPQQVPGEWAAAARRGGGGGAWHRLLRGCNCISAAGVPTTGGGPVLSLILRLEKNDVASQGSWQALSCTLSLWEGLRTQTPAPEAPTGS